MAIDRLSSTSALIAALRAEATRKSGRPESRSTATASTGTTPQAQQSDIARLRRELAEILRDVSPDDEQAMDAARPNVVRAVLLWEFGADLREHSEWQPMLATLVRTMEENPQHREQFSAMIRELLPRV